MGQPEQQVQVVLVQTHIQLGHLLHQQECQVFTQVVEVAAVPVEDQRVAVGVVEQVATLVIL